MPLDTEVKFSIEGKDSPQTPSTQTWIYTRNDGFKQPKGKPTISAIGLLSARSPIFKCHDRKLHRLVGGMHPERSY